MKSAIKQYILFVLLTLFMSMASVAQNTASMDEAGIAGIFEKRAIEYAEMRETIGRTLPALPKEASAEQIEQHKTDLFSKVRALRTNAKVGDIFTPGASELIRSIIDLQYSGTERAELLKEIFEAENEGVPLKINAEYPEAKELLATPPKLLTALPKLPEQLRYRFVGRNILLVDRENGLIVDYMTEAFGRGRDLAPPVQTRVSEPPAPAAPKARDTGTITLPVAEESIKFAAFGDAGRGSEEQYELGRMMFKMYQWFPYDFVLLTGDNIYGSKKPEDYKQKFENVYKPLLDGGVKFYASLGNHDDSNQRFYKLFNMDGKEYYRLEKDGAAFYSLNSTYMDKPQLEWLITQLSNDTAKWKIAFFHHPPYSSGDRHGSDKEIRDALHPLFVKYGVTAVFTGHDHFYERVKLQDGVQYFVTGAAGKIRKGNIDDDSGLTAKGFDTDLSFMLVEIKGDEMHFQVIAKSGATVDSGIITVRNTQPAVVQAQSAGGTIK